MLGAPYPRRMKLRTALMFLAPLLAVLLVACGSGGGVTPRQQTLAEEVLAQVNAARASGANCGGVQRPAVSRVALSDRLIQAAQIHSDDMESMRQLTHTGSDGSNPGQRIARTGYQAATWGENAAVGYRSESAVVAGWLRSEGHCNNMMNAAYTEIGAARAGDYWTLVLARPRYTRLTRP